ncbi:MAG TPA: ChaN family lipoprotein [Bacteroidia bacterium]|jgi:uncharacterized iron-regulated protein|nr:ChaN family lipoprotein [Bacteroidia bacterium]
MNNRFFAFLFFISISVISSAQTQTDTSKILTEKSYRIYSVKLGKEVSMQDVVNDMQNYDVVFYGEEHNDSVSHYAEKTLLTLLYNKYNSTICLSMEMFDRDVQGVMNEYLNGYIREKDFKKDARVWSNYRDYRPMVEFAKTNHLDVVCANSPSRYTNIAGRKGEKGLELLPETSKKYFAPLPYDTATGKYYQKLEEMSGHTMTPTTPSKNDTSKQPVMPPKPMMSFDLVVAQSLWDATMAYSISEYLKGHPQQKVMQVNGRFHSEEGYAIVTQLKKYSPKAKILIVSSTSDDNFPTIDWSQYKTLGDYILVTDPKVPKTFKD